MTGDGSRPWWYSGDDESEQQQEWPKQSADAPDPGPSGSGLGDWSTLLSGAVRMVDWATSAVMAPHAEHDDPAEHPTCVICRTITLVGDPSGLVPGSETVPAAPAQEPRRAPSVTWIRIRDE